MERPSHPAPGLAGSVLEEGFRVTDGSIRFLAGLSLAALAAIIGIVSYRQRGPGGLPHPVRG